MIDLHAHIIPNLDDGADSFTEAEMIAQDAVDGGTTALVATPHYFNRHQCLTESTREYVIQLFNRLKLSLEKAQIPLELYLGAEIFAGHDLEKTLTGGQLITLNDTQYTLVEFDFADSPARVMSCIDLLLRYGCRPVVAHPERYTFLQDNPHMVYRLLDKGCTLQLNKGSPLGAYGSVTAEFSQWLLKNKLVHVVASDCHSPYRRTANMENAHRHMSMHLDDEYVYHLFEENPQKILNGENVN